MNDVGTVVAAATGPDAVASAVANVNASRADDARPWSIAIGAGTYGDVLVNEPNLTVRAAAGAAVTLTGAGTANNTGGGCIDVTRGNVTLAGIACSKPTDVGIEIRPPATEGGIVLRGVGVTDSTKEGIHVVSGADVVIENSSATSAAPGFDGLRMEGLTGPGPYRVQGGSFTQNGGDGIDLTNSQRVQVIGLTVQANRESGVEIDGAQNFSVSLDGVTARNNVTHGVSLVGGGNQVSVQNSRFGGNRRTGVLLGRMASPVLNALTFEGTNGVDLSISPDVRTGGTYTNLVFIDTPITLPLEPRGVLLDSATAAERRARSPLPRRTVTLGRFLRIRDSGAGSSVVRLNFLLTPADVARVQSAGIRVYEDDPAGNRRRWQLVRGSRLEPGFAFARLADNQIASGSDGRFAMYAPLAPRNAAPAIASVFPVNQATWVGRDVVVSAAVRDDAALATSAYNLTIDGRRRTRLELRGGTVVWPFVRLPVGPHSASLTVTDSGGRTATTNWAFTVINRTPQVKRLRSRPAPRQVVRSRGFIRLSILMSDDEAILRDRANVKVDGRKVAVRKRGNRLVARVPIRLGRHVLTVVYTDLDGAQARRGWRFRVVRP
jgi:hypothetical protein